MKCLLGPAPAGHISRVQKCQHNAPLNQKAFDWTDEAEIPSVDMKYCLETFGDTAYVTGHAPALCAPLLRWTPNRWIPAFRRGSWAGAGACLCQCSGRIKDLGMGDISYLLVSKHSANWSFHNAFYEFKAKMDGALSNLLYWKSSLPMAGVVELDDL